MTLAVGRHCLDLSRKERGNILLVGMEDDIEEMRKSSKQELFRRMSSRTTLKSWYMYVLSMLKDLNCH